ncbi:hypothetical protein [Micromonospora haikouensis]|uniref:hypothetical protein n=1 Tax=Micromonospora haikouensis TaxID=686309 RepID=UPI003D715FA1
MADYFNTLDRPGALFVRRTADHAGIASSTTVADDGVLQVSVAAGAVYVLQAMIVYTAPAAGDIKIGWSAPSGASLTWTPCGLTTTTSATAGSIRMPAKTLADTDIPGAVDVSTPVAALPTGLLVVGSTGGLLKLQWAQGVSDLGLTVVKAGSYLMLTRAT